MRKETSLTKKNTYSLLLLPILLWGGFLIFAGADWGLPTLLHPDEGTIVNTAIRMVQDRMIMPDVYFRPDHLLIQINAFLYRLIILINGVSAENIHDVGPGVFYLTARIVTGVFAMGSIVMGYLIGRRYSNATGLFSAFLFAVFPLFITHSKYATSDIPTTFFMLLFIYSALVYMRKPTLKQVVVMSLVTAAFITVKYPGAILCAMIAISVIVRGIADKRYIRILGHEIAAVFFTALFVFLISPVLLLNFRDVRSAIINEARPVHLGADGLGMGGNMLFYLNTYIVAGGIILLVFFFFGCYALFSKKRDFYFHLPLFYSFIYWVCLSYLPLHWERWALPMYAAPLLISAIGISKVYEMTKANKIALPAFIAVLCLSALNLASSSFASQLAFLLPDTRVVSQSYVQESGITEYNTVFEGYTTLNPTDPGEASWLFESIDGVYHIKYSRVKHIIISSMIFDRYKNEPLRYADQVAFYDSLNDNFTEIKRFDAIRRDTSPVDYTNIVNNVSYIKRAADHGMSGPTLIFYETSAENYSPYILSSTVYFDDANRTYERYYMKGLSDQEETGVWTSGSETRFLFHLTDPGSDLLLSFTVTPFTRGITGSQNVKVTANGESLGTIEISETGTYDVAIPKRVTNDNILDLRFLFPGEQSRALFFHELTITPH